MRRRNLLYLMGSAGAVAVAGCVEGGDGPDASADGQDSGTTDGADSDPDGDETDPDPDEEPSEDTDDGEPGDHEYDHPGEAVEAFLDAWQDGDVEAFNALVYEDGDLPPFEGEPEELVADAPEVETIASPEIDGDTARVETLLVFPEMDVPQAQTFVLVDVDGAWLLAGLAPEVEVVAPAVEFDASFEDGTLVLTHAGGDAVPAGDIHVRGEGLDETGAWHELADVDPDQDVVVGMSIGVDVADEYSLELVWEGDEQSALLYAHSGARETVSESDTPVDSHLADTDNYDGTVEDFTGEDEVAVTVGATDSDGNAHYFDPPAVRVDEGTTVVWEWTGEGGAHTVTHDADEPAFESDLADEEGATFSHTFEDSGTYPYVCQPHAGLGMKGAIVVG